VPTGDGWLHELKHDGTGVIKARADHRDRREALIRLAVADYP
jgi:hypothetical protein